MTFEEFHKKLPKGITGGIMRRSDDFWSIKLWLNDDEPAPKIGATFHIYLRGKEGETTELLLARALPSAEAFVKAAGITKAFQL